MVWFVVWVQVNMEGQHHHAGCTADPRLGWELVQHDWSVRALDEPRSRLAALVAGVRRVIAAVRGAAVP